MKVKSIQPATIEYVEFDDDAHTYVRLSADNWSIQIGESTETVFACEEMEKAYQERKAEKLRKATTIPPEVVEVCKRPNAFGGWVYDAPTETGVPGFVFTTTRATKAMTVDGVDYTLSRHNGYVSAITISQDGCLLGMVCP